MTVPAFTIRDDADVATGAAALVKIEPRFGTVLEQTGPLPLRLRPAGFRGLLDIIISQQVSVASADAIRQRLGAAGIRTEADVRASGEAGLRAVGFSRSKARYALGLAEAQVDFEALQQMPDEEVARRLTALTGIGPWTAEVYLMFCLGRPDILPSGDLALQVAAQALFDLPERPAPMALATLAEDWAPWRSVAARALFAYYRLMKNKEGL